MSCIFFFFPSRSKEALAPVWAEDGAIAGQGPLPLKGLAQRPACYRLIRQPPNAGKVWARMGAWHSVWLRERFGKRARARWSSTPRAGPRAARWIWWTWSRFKGARGWKIRRMNGSVWEFRPTLKVQYFPAHAYRRRSGLPGPTGHVDVGYTQMDLLPLGPLYEVACDL